MVAAERQYAMPPIIYTKLRDGSWGIKAQPGIELQTGAEVTVEKKSGATKTEVVGTILSENDKGTIARVARGEAQIVAVKQASPAITPDTPLGKAQAAAIALLAAFESGIIQREAAEVIMGELLTTLEPKVAEAA